MKFIVQQEPPELSCVIKAGQRFKFEGDSYILARVSQAKYGLINLDTGNRWNEPGTLEEMAKILNDNGFKIERYVE